MSFQIKSFAAIAAGIINHARATQVKATDFTVGSILRTLLEAPAVEIEELYLQFFNGLREAIPSAVFRAFSFERKAASPATGLVRLVFAAQSTPRIIAAGTSFVVSGAAASFSSVEEVTVGIGVGTVNVRVNADEAGLAGNVVGGTAFTMAPALAGLTVCQALTDFTGGADLETDDERRARFVAYVQSLPHGTLASIEYALSTVRLFDGAGAEVERVAHYFIDEVYLRSPLLPTGMIDVYVHNGAAPGSLALQTRATEVLHGYTDASGQKVPGYKAAGVRLTVYPATEQALNVAADVVVAPGYAWSTVNAAITTAINAYIAGLQIGQTAFPAELVSVAMALPGVASFVVSAPFAPVTPLLGQKLMPGAIALTQVTGSFVFPSAV